MNPPNYCLLLFFKMSDNEDVQLSISSSSGAAPDVRKRGEGAKRRPSDPGDKPNIVVDGQKEVHMRVSASDTGDGSIDAEDNRKIPVNSSKDPDISHVPQKGKGEKDKQSQCCLIL